MAIEIIKIYREHLPPLRFVGKCYRDADRDSSGSFGSKWAEWFAEGWFARLEQLGEVPELDNGYIGLMGRSEAENSFQYWIGMFLPVNTVVPEGFCSLDMPEGDVGICWIKGLAETGEIYGEKAHNMCLAQLEENNLADYRADFKGATEKWWWFFERYNCPRFTKKDADGSVILDYGVYIK